MKKKCNGGTPYWDICLRKILLVMKLTSIFMLCLLLQVSATTYSQNVKINLDMKEVSMIDVIKEIRRQTGFKFFFNHNELKNMNNITVKAENAEMDRVLKDILSKENLGFQVERGVIIITPQTTQLQTQQVPNALKIQGTVTDESGNALPGVSVVIKGTSIGVATDADGKFTIEITNPENTVLILSFIGMKNYELKINKSKTAYKVVMQEEQTTLDDVVVTGFFTKNKNSFTGSVKTLEIEDIKAVSNTNLISAIAMMTPGLKLLENNEFGSDPNRLPEIVIRGTSSLATDADESANQPIIILDGVEISLRDLYDIDINDIERVDVLKDASATALYGEKAANGVIIIERKKILNDKIRVNYNLDGSLDVPDLRTYDYLEAADKLEFERLAGLYNFETKEGYEDYNRKKIAISKGANTNWLAKPLRSGFSINNSVGISGRGNGMTYRLNANLKNIHGVMKDDYRNTYGISVFLSYHVDNKLTVSLQSQYSNVKSKNSPYGMFSHYVIVNPYDTPYDEYGKLIKTLSYDISNPLYEAECGNFYETESYSFLNSLNIRWDILKNLYVTAAGSLTTSGEKIEDYQSPQSNAFKDVIDIVNKGSMTTNHKKGMDYSGKFIANYIINFGENNLLSLHAGTDIYKEKSITDEYTAVGYFKPNLHSPWFGAGYVNGHPEGKEELSTRLGVFGNLNFIVNNKYFVDGSIRRSGSSKFGSENRYAPFWSAGAGWNLHNERFLHYEWLNTLRLRYSYGVTGNISFSPYQAITTYLYSSDNYYLHGIGAIPKTMGNKDLTWQSTNMHNLGLSIDLFNNRFSATFDYYVKTTEDMLIDMTIPPSVGETTVKNNLGRMRNTGFEFDVSALIISKKNWRFSLKVNGSHNENKILAISNSLQKMNEESNSTASTSPKVLYREGQSTSAIYAVRSAGINPATGEEVFIKKNGTYTLEYDANDKVVLGDEEPDLEGAIFPYLSWKNWSLNLSIKYRFGGELYNTTRAINVENVNPKHNVDKRAFEERWKNINDIPPYLDIANADSRSSIHTSRFIEKDNTLEIKRIEVAYEFNPESLRKIGFKRLRLSVGANDPFRFSTIRLERGTSYPFSRGFSFSVSPTF